MNCNVCLVILTLGDQFCANCGTASPPSQTVDFARIWLGEIIEARHVARFSAIGFYVLQDVAAASDAELLALPGIGSSQVAELRLAMDSIASNEGAIRAQIDGRRGTCFDPVAPVLSPQKLNTIAMAGLEPSQIPVTVIPAQKATHTLFRKARIRTFADLAPLANIDLIRRLRSRMPEVIVEIDCGIASYLSQIADPDSPANARVRQRDEIDPDAGLTGLPWLASRIIQMDDRQRLVVTLRNGLAGNDPQTLEQIGEHLGVTRERVRQIEAKAMDKFRLEPGRLAALKIEINRLSATVSLAPNNDRFMLVAQTLGSPDLGTHASLLSLAIRILKLDRDQYPVISDIDAAVVSVLADGSARSAGDLVSVVLSMLDPDELAQNPSFDLLARLSSLGPAIQRADGRWTLPHGSVTGFSDKRIRRLQTMRAILEESGPSHFSFVAEQMKCRLPEDYWLDDRGVHSWFARFTGIFVWSGRGTYGLKSQDVGIRQEAAQIATDGMYRSQTSRRKGIGEEIAAYLRENGPSDLDSVEEHILARFSVQQTSIYAAITQDKARRFAFEPSGKICSLR